MNKPIVFTTEGQVQAKDGTYLERDADAELLQLCRQGEFAYVLTSRQMGKSSLMYQTSYRLRQEGIRTAIIDLQRIGKNTATIENWYQGFLSELVRPRRLNLPISVQDWWREHKNLSATQRLVLFIETVVLEKISAPVVIFVDEIDTTIKLDFTDDFFIAIRSFYTERGENPAFRRLSFVLIGVATPSDLISDPSRTSFNVGHPINLTDFTFQEALPFTAGLGLPEKQGQKLLQWILEWTGGHPYLTQRVCLEIVQQGQTNWTEKDVEKLVAQLFFGDQRDQNGHLKFVRDRLIRADDVNKKHVLEVLRTYQKIWQDHEDISDEEQSAIASQLKLSGVVKRIGKYLEVRNLIYREVFDQVWIREQWPETWWERLKPAMPVITGLALVSLAMGGMALYAQDKSQQTARALEELKQKKEEAEQATLQAETEVFNTSLLAEALKVENLITRDFDFEAWKAAIRLGKKIQTYKQDYKNRKTTLNVYDIINLQAVYALAKNYYAEHLRLRNSLKGHSKAVWSASFSPDGNILASASSDGTIKLWEYPSGREIQTLQGHSSEVLGVSFSPDGKTIASTGSNGTIDLWEYPSGRAIQTLQGHAKAVLGVSFSPDGNTLASASHDGTVKLWEYPSGREIQTLQGHSSEVLSVSFSPDGNTLASASHDGTVKLWEYPSGREIQTLRGHSDEVRSISFSPDGKTLASASYDGTVKLWEYPSGREIQTLQGHSSKIWSVSFSPNGNTLASASSDGTIKLWEYPSGREIQTLQSHSDRILSVSFSPNGNTLASTSYDNTINLWEYPSDREIQILQGHSSSVLSISISPDGNTLASASSDGTIKLWEYLSGQEIQTLQGHSDAVRSVSFSPDGNTLASASADRTIKLWEYRSGQEIQTLQGHSDEVRNVSFSPDGKTLASASQDGTIKLWEYPSGREIQTLQAHASSIRSVSFSPDGKTFASASADRTIKLWEYPSGQEIKILKAHVNEIRDVRFSPNENILASASYDGTVKLWKYPSGQEIQTLRGHSGAVWSVSFSPDGNTLASASADGTVKLWEYPSGREIQTLQGHSRAVKGVRFSPDGSILASASYDGTVKLWSFDLDDLLTKSCYWFRHYITNPTTPRADKELCASELDVANRNTD